MVFVHTSPIVGVDLDNKVADADGPLFAIGMRVPAEGGGEFEYVHANGAITQYDFVSIDEDGECAALTTANAQAGFRIGAAQIAFDDNDYGWVALSGKGGSYKGRVASSCAADTTLNTTGTAGVLDDDNGGQDIQGVVITTAASGAGPEAEEIIIAAGGMHAADI